MNNEYIRKQDALDACGEKYSPNTDFERGVMCQMICNKVRIERLQPVDVVPYSISSDGTLTVTVPKGTKRIGRILIEEDGTRYGGLFYPDTGGCFLSSMEKE